MATTSFKVGNFVKLVKSVWILFYKISLSCLTTTYRRLPEHKVACTLALKKNIPWFNGEISLNSCNGRSPTQTRSCIEREKCDVDWPCVSGWRAVLPSGLPQGSGKVSGAPLHSALGCRRHEPVIKNKGIYLQFFMQISDEDVSHKLCKLWFQSHDNEQNAVRRIYLFFKEKCRPTSCSSFAMAQ